MVEKADLSTPDIGSFPHSEHHCGFNAYFDLEKSKRNSWNFMVPGSVFDKESGKKFFGDMLGRHIVGAIAGAGNLQIHQSGFRSEQAQILAFLVSKNQSQQMFEKLASYYSVPVFDDELKFLEFVYSKAAHIDNFRTEKIYDPSYSESWRNLIWPLDSLDDKPSLVHEGIRYWYRDDLLHRDTGPAFVSSEGTQKWYQHGKLHKDNGPAIVSETENTRHESWYQRGLPHRDDDLPASVLTTKRSGEQTLIWQSHGKYHRDNRPAITHADGTKVWYHRGACYRAEGPNAAGYPVDPKNAPIPIIK